MFWYFLCLRIRASLIYINKYPTRCNTKHSSYYSASSLYIFQVSTTPIRSTQNCNYSLRYWSCCTVQLPPSNVAKLVWPRWREATAQKIWSVAEALVTVLCTPDGCGWHLKHIQWTCRIINRMLCVASRRTIINMFWCSYHLSSKTFIILKSTETNITINVQSLVRS